MPSRARRTPSSPDLALSVAVTALAELELWASAARVEGRLLDHLLLNLLILPMLLLRRSHPVWAAAVAGLTLALQPLAGSAPVATGFLALLGVLFSLGWHCATRHGLAGLTVVLAGGLVYDVTNPVFVLGDLVVNVAIIVAAWAAGRGLRTASDHRVAAEVAAEVAADRSARLAVDEERSRISRDLHDSLAHALTLMTLQAGSARERTTDAPAARALATIEESGRAAIADMHRFLELLAQRTEGAPGLPEVSDLVAGVRRGGLAVDLALTAPPVTEAVSAAVYRVVQEGLTNAIRHSDARSARVEVGQHAGEVVVVVASTGAPCAASLPGGGRGLPGLRQRVAALGGRIDSGPTPDGWLLEARLPLDGVAS